jgi:hypothetical protein
MQSSSVHAQWAQYISVIVLLIQLRVAHSAIDDVPDKYACLSVIPRSSADVHTPEDSEAANRCAPAADGPYDSADCLDQCVSHKIAAMPRVPRLAPSEQKALEVLAKSNAWSHVGANANTCITLRAALQREPTCTLIKNCSSCLTPRCLAESKKPGLPPDQCWKCPDGGVQCQKSKFIPSTRRIWNDAIGCEFWDSSTNPNLPDGTPNDGHLHVTFISLAGCQMRFAPNFTAFHQLNILDLKYNLLTKFPPALPQDLTGLFLTANHIDEIPSNATSSLKKLAMLYINENRLTNVPKELFDMPTGCHLKELGLSNNKINTIPVDVIASACGPLERLFLDGNNLTAAELEPPNSLMPPNSLTNLTLIALSRNSNLRYVPGWIWQLPSLQILGAQHCDLGHQLSKSNQIPFVTASNLEALDFSWNTLYRLPDNIHQFQKLEVLDASNNL